jgi:hypothetical protein
VIRKEPKIRFFSKTKLMPDDVVFLQMFSSEIEAVMAQQVLQEGGVSAFIFKDDAGGMEPHLQRTAGIPTRSGPIEYSKR